MEILLPWLGNENNEMTRDQITRLAKEAGIRDCTCDGDFGCIERFASLVAAHEREECAKRLDSVGCDNCAANIRARGKHD